MRQKKQHFPLSNLRADSDGSESARFEAFTGIRAQALCHRANESCYPALQEASYVTLHHLELLHVRDDWIAIPQSFPVSKVATVTSENRHEGPVIAMLVELQL